MSISTKKLENIKLIVFDLDGTLLNDEDGIGNNSVQLITELRKLGVKFSFASGRLHSAMIKHAEKLNLTTPLISLDGSYIKSYPDGKILSESYVSARYVKRAIKLADNLLLKVALCHGDAVYYTDHNSTIPEMLDKFGAHYEKVEFYEDYLDRTLELVVAGDQKESIQKFMNKMTFPYTFGLTTTYYKSHRYGDIYYFEARKKGCDKGTALIKLAKHLGISINETAVAGDWYNDRKMFDTGAISIAVANAVNEIKYHADFVTCRSNNEDGITEFLAMVLKAKTKN